MNSLIKKIINNEEVELDSDAPQIKIEITIPKECGLEEDLTIGQFVPLVILHPEYNQPRADTIEVMAADLRNEIKFRENREQNE